MNNKALRTAATVPARHKLLSDLPMLGLGTADNEKGDASMAEAIRYGTQECGVQMLDTAQNYGSEIAIGKGLRGTRRSSVFIGTKVDLASASFEDPRQRVRRQVASSLSNMGLTYIDSVVIHWPVCLDDAEADHKLARAHAWQALEELHHARIVRHIGVSNWSSNLLDELLATAAVRPVLNQVEWSPVCHDPDLLAQCEQAGIAIVGYSPYGTCWMSKHAQWAVQWAQTPLTSDATVLDVAAQVSRADGAGACSAALVLLRWAMQLGVAPIPKSTDPSRIAESMRAFDGALALNSQQMERLCSLRDRRRGVDASIERHLRIIGSRDYDGIIACGGLPPTYWVDELYKH